jgi:hypothetical protein
MTIELKERISARTGKTPVQTTAGNFGKRRSWIHCPRCIGGSMYLDNNGEFVCIQCGCSCFPAAATQMPPDGRESHKTESNLFQDISNALRNRRGVESSDSAGRQ